jgi:2-dehydro-3-deoxyphosphogluconate aldolase / (4S)-4-hydroxy-2-oxoglutarate aldolase
MSAAQRIRATRAIAILRLRDHGLAVEVGHALAGAGLDIMEITLDHPDGLAALRRLADEVDAVVGAGTVRSAEQARAAADAGATFCVSPGVDAGVVRAALDAGMEPLPGAFTATEVGTALDAGARLVKLFPAGPAGPAYLRALLGPFGDVELVPTGGIRHEAAGDWIRAGATAVGLGSDLVPARPAAADVDAIAARAAAVIEQVQA